MTEKFHQVSGTFLGVPSAADAAHADVAIFGAAHGTAYAGAQSKPPSETGPDAVRRAITAASVHIDHWDFDFDGPLLNDGALKVVDLGNVPTTPHANENNRHAIENATRDTRAHGAVPILIGGDDSTGIPFMSGFSDLPDLHILQIDAHIDWRDHIGDERFGYSSTMRRASELANVRSITQVGIRAVGSALREEVETATSWGARIFTVHKSRASGMTTVADALPRHGHLLIHIDLDALDPSICPGVNALSPGGLRLDEVTDLIAAAMQGRTLAGLSIVELDPAADINAMTATVAGRLICHVLGHLARSAPSGTRQRK
ncbi:hypothetical protein ASE04_19295 [Rhizobium sp. Root708]|uniref:arginase family protein n=1 Tax=Rhizobium sp. Root708 TaxID=1736592 RepID=UPI0006F64B1C|nr:arginase family protein [Rhizobium sp. Root708]KRB62031.1 hypothetical protein ASE04_19295 [Rhizobium sp. Root708]